MIANLNKSFESRLRLGIMSILMVSEWVEFNVLKQKLSATDGNLASHLSALEKAEYVKVQKRFVGKKPNSMYAVTIKGYKAFEGHLHALEKLINGIG